MLKQGGVPVTDVSVFVGGGAILGHKVVTLSRELHAGLLADFICELSEMEKLGLQYIDLVYCNLYPLQQEIAKPDATRQSVIKQTDIGGPTMLRSAGKGGRIVICDPSDQKKVLDWLDAGRPNKDEFLNNLFVKVEKTVAQYCLSSAVYHSCCSVTGIIGTKVYDCCYGQNKNEKSILYSVQTGDPLAIPNFVRIEGTDSSHINVTDMDSSLDTLCRAAEAFRREKYFPYMAIAVKHGNACGAAFGESPQNVLKQMILGDRLSIFGGLVMTNFPMDSKLAHTLIYWNNINGQKRRLIDCLVAPSISREAIEIMRRFQDKCRFVVNCALASKRFLRMSLGQMMRPVRGGYILQSPHQLTQNPAKKEYLINGRSLTKTKLYNALFAWAIASSSVSNTVVLVKNKKLIGNGCGRQSRVDACRLAVQLAIQAGHDIHGAVAWSDSFFPAIDGPELLIDAGASDIFTTSGSKADGDVIKLCKKRNIRLVMIPDVLNRAFCRH